MSGHAWATVLVAALFAATTVAIVVHLREDPITYIGPSATP